MAQRKLDVSFGAKRVKPEDTLESGLPPEARRRTGRRDFSVKVPRNVAGTISAPEQNIVQSGVNKLSRGLSVFGGGDERAQVQRASDIANAIGYVSDPFASFYRTGKNVREQLEGGQPVTTQDYINLATPAVAELLGVAGSRLARTAPAQRLAGWLGETKPRLVDPDFIEGRFRVVPRGAAPAASTSPTRPFISGPPSAPRLTPPKPFWERADEADRYLTGDAATAVNRFVGHEPGGVTGNTGLGWMIAGPLEEAYAAPSRVQAQLSQAFDPLREALRVDRGPAITLFRAQRPVTTDEGVTYMARGEAPARNVLSWTDDPRVAEAFAGINPRLKPPSAYSEEDIQRLEDEYARTGKIDLGQYQIIREDTDYGPMNSIYGGQDNFITDTDSIRKYLEDQNEWANAYNAELAAKRENIVSADVPLEDIVWATNRLGQREFIVRNRPGSPYYIDETGKISLSVKPTESSLSVSKVPATATPAEEGVDLGVKRAKELAVDGMSKEIQPSDVVRLLRSNNQDLFVRWSHGPKYDLAPNARSKDYQTGLFHDGLSANRLEPNDPYGVIARTLGEYEFHKTSPEVNAHIYSGKVLGRDSDNAFSIRPTEHLGKIPSEFFDDLRAGEATILGAFEDVNRYSAALQNDPTSPHAGYWKKALETAKANLEAADPATRKMLQWFGLDAP